MKRKLATIAFLICCGLLSYCSPEDAKEQPVAITETPAETLITEFSLETANKVPPDNVTVLKEITYFGAPYECPLCDDCETEQPKYSKPAIAQYPEDAELMLTSAMRTCGWSSGENLTGKITYPDGRLKLESILAGDYFDAGEASLYFRPLFSDPEGVYEFEISNGRIALESRAYFYYPEGPRLYEHGEQLVFLNFSPNETLRLFMYEPYDSDDPDVESAWKFAGWQDIKVDESGDRFLDIPVMENCFVAVTSSDVEYATEDIGSILQDTKLTTFLEFIKMLFSTP